MNSALIRVPAHLAMFALLFAAAALLVAARRRNLDMRYYRWLVMALLGAGVYFYLLALSVKATAFFDREVMAWWLGGLEWFVFVCGARWLVGTARRSFTVQRRQTPHGTIPTLTD